MKAIIPVAGIGKRLRPHTYSAPKVLLQVAGKPIIAHIIDEIVKVGVKEITFVVGYMGDKIRDWVAENYKIKANYVVQEELLGLGHAISITRHLHADDSEVLIILGDTIFRADLKSVVKKSGTYIAVKEVDDPRRFGIVELRGGYITYFREKPKRPKTNLALPGIYLIRNPRLLFSCLDELIEKDIRTAGEYQLTDALKLMLKHGERMRPFQIQGWYDCGKPETLLSTNRELLDLKYSSGANPYRRRFPDSVIKMPVSIAKNARISNSIVGPYVTVAEGVEIQDSIVANSVLSKESSVKNIVLEASIIGDGAKVVGQRHSLNIGDSSEASFT